MVGSERSAYLFLSLLQARVGCSYVSRLDGAPPSDLLRMTTAEFAARFSVTDKARDAFDALRRSFDSEAMLGRLEERGISLLTQADGTYPTSLGEVPDPPPALYVEGRLSAGPAVAVVGSRKATATGLESARALGRALGARGVCVVSGLALGVDAAAHEGALEVGASTVGVLGCGINVVYPSANRRLFDGVRSTGALVSEYFLDEAPLPWRFPARNRIIAGLSDAVVIVEAAEKSGALISARHAAEAGRDVWAVPGAISVPECRGSNCLLADGAGVLWDIDEFLASVGGQTGPPTLCGRNPDEGTVPEGLPETEMAVLVGVGFGPSDVDAIAERSGVTMRDLLPALAILELKGYVTRGAGGAYVRRVGP